MQGKEFRKLGEILEKIGESGKRIFASFPGFSDVGVISGTAVMARRAGRRDRGKSGISGEVADNCVGAAHGERRWPERWRVVPTGFAGIIKRGKKMIGGFEGIIKLSGKFLKTRVI
jgi:hypothetical protein